MIKLGIPDKLTPGFWNNFGRCCGNAGVIEYVLGLARITGNQAYKDFAIKHADHIISNAIEDGSGMRWALAEHRARPEELTVQTGLMQGASGIGLGLLNLHCYLNGKSLEIEWPDSVF